MIGDPEFEARCWRAALAIWAIALTIVLGLLVAA